MKPQGASQGLKLRADIAMVQRGLAPSREKAQRAIMAGLVRINDRPLNKPGETVRPDDVLTITASEKYVSRGGYKLEGAIQDFNLQIKGKVIIDIGSSTGGFTDCLLQNGAAKVFAVDVGAGLLAWKLRNDPRVVVMENTNARYLTAESFPQPFELADMAVIDCSFISIKKILPVALKLIRNHGQILGLIKPQFEAGRHEAARGKGVIKDPLVHERVIAEIKEFANSLDGVLWNGCTQSKLIGPAGNKEFFVLLEKQN